jgi:hypothetical protein
MVVLLRDIRSNLYCKDNSSMSAVYCLCQESAADIWWVFPSVDWTCERSHLSPKKAHINTKICTPITWAINSIKRKAERRYLIFQHDSVSCVVRRRGLGFGQGFIWRVRCIALLFQLNFCKRIHDNQVSFATIYWRLWLCNFSLNIISDKFILQW